MEFTMEVKFMRYCMAQYYQIYYHGGNIEKAIDRCFGALMFLNNCFEGYDATLNKWWDDEMLPKFRTLNFKKR